MNETPDFKIAQAIASREPRHLGQPTTPPLAWQRAATPGWMVVILADGRKICRPIASPGNLLPASIPAQAGASEAPSGSQGRIKRTPTQKDPRKGKKK